MRVQDIIVSETKADPDVVKKFAGVSDSQRSYYIMKWSEEKGIDSDEAMELAGYTKGSYIGYGSYNWHYNPPRESVANEAPAGMLGQIGRKIGAKVAGAVGAKGKAAELTGKAEVGDEANQLKTALRGYAGQTGINVKQMQGPQLAAFLKSKGYPNMHLKNVQGIMTPKQIDQAIMTAAQDAAKADGDPSTGASTAPAQPSAPAAGAAPGKPAAPQVDKNKDGKDDATGQPMGSVDANKDGKDDNTGKVIPMPKSIPPEIQKQLDALSPTEKKVLAGAL
tara:strand:+ start:281 stop:1117 length:837 start_codon:yes stop_codon:yes gene_type:complete